MSTNVKKKRRYSREYKLKVLKERQETNITIKQLCKKHDISTSTFNGWKKRYEKHGENGLADNSSAPKSRPQETPKEIQEKVVQVKKSNMFLGSRKLKEYLERFEGIFLSSATINKILRRFGFKPADEIIQAEARKNDPKKKKEYEEEQAALKKDWQRFCRANPKDLYQIDLMTFYIRDVHRVWLISIMDDHSRFIANWGLFRDKTAENVLEVLKGALIKYGLPEEILTDNGKQFTAWKGVTLFEKLLNKLNIHHTKATAHHPQTLGKLESYHKNIQRELIDVEVFRSMEEAATRITDYVEHYNYARTHQGIGGLVPADRFFGIAKEIERKKTEQKAIGNEKILVGGNNLIYLVGKLFGHSLRIQDEGGKMLVYVDGNLRKSLDFTLKSVN